MAPEIVFYAMSFILLANINSYGAKPLIVVRQWKIDNLPFYRIYYICQDIIYLPPCLLLNNKCSDLFKLFNVFFKNQLMWFFIPIAMLDVF